MSDPRLSLRPTPADLLILVGIVAACCTWQGLLLLGLLTYVAFPLLWMLSRSRTIQVSGPKGLADRLGPWIALSVVLNWMFLIPSVLLDVWPASWQTWPFIGLGLVLGSLPCVLLPVWFLIARIEDRQRPDDPGAEPVAAAESELEPEPEPDRDTPPPDLALEAVR